VRSVLDTSVDSLVHGGGDQDGSLVGELVYSQGVSTTYDLDKVDTDKVAHSLIISKTSSTQEITHVGWVRVGRKSSSITQDLANTSKEE
jgi:hypothetical protein